jgi:formylglycine-generating enzyme required for sulfatase activity
MIGAKGVALMLSLAAAVLFAQEPVYKNTIGMEFALIQPGSMLVGKYEPTCPTPGGRGGGGGGRAAQSPGATQGAPGGAPPPSAAPKGAAAGQSPGGGRAARGPADPRNHWTEKDYADCQEMAKKASLPGFTVKIEKRFYMGKTEVTQAQWKKVMGTNPSVFQGDKVKDDADQHPVDSVTWADAQAFIKKLNALEKTKAYRLPTEFEWEYAARAGSDKEVAGYRDYSWTGENNKPTTHAVAGKKPNEWGLYDMIGNVWEWVADHYNEKFFPDPVPPKSGKEHVLRGASFIGDVHNASVFTHGAGPGNGWDVGFRIVRDVPK